MKHTVKVATVALTAMFIWQGCASKSTAPSAGPIDPATNLAAPARGEGFQLKTDAFPVAAGVEEQDCYFFKVRDLAASNGLAADQPVYLHRIQIAQKEGSHHMNLFRVKTRVGLDPDKGVIQRAQNGQGECFKSPNWADWPIIANTQLKGETDWTFPEGVANEFLPDEWIMLQTHYVNATSQKSPEGVGAVAANFFTIPKDKVKAQLGTVFATKQSVRVCAKNPTPRFEGSCQINSPAPVTIIGANGHFHGRGTEFDIYKWDGTTAATPPEGDRFYQSLKWDEPPMLHSPEINVTVPAAGGVWYSCSYQWQQPDPAAGGCDALNAFDETKYKTPKDQQDCCYTFGPIVDKNEHCNAFIYYYPKQDNVTCF
jgi:hypothetical protein